MPGEALVLVENLSVPFDRRVWQECRSLTEAGWRVSVVCPRGRKRGRLPVTRAFGRGASRGRRGRGGHGFARLAVALDGDGLAVGAAALRQKLAPAHAVGRLGRGPEHTAPAGDEALRLAARALRGGAVDGGVGFLDPHALVRGSVLDRHGGERERALLVLGHVPAAPEQLRQQRLRGGVAVLGQHGEIVQPALDVGARGIVAEVGACELELRLAVAKEGGGVVEKVDGAARAWRQADLLDATACEVGQRNERLGDEGRALDIVGVDVEVLVRKLAEQHIGLGPVGDAAADARAKQLREHIAELNAALRNVRLLGREGFKLADAKTYATVASLHNHAVFEAGAVLIGSHAYGALLNQLGARAGQYATQDVDIAGSAKLAFPEPPQKSFLEMIRASGIAFVEIPGLSKRKPATSFKEAGRSFFQVDLLVPSGTDEIGTAPLPALRAHATALPYLKYLLAAPQESVLLAREGCCALRVPRPERFALHKLLVSQLRKQRAQKSVKDVSQAAVLLAILSEMHPGALEEAAAAVPVSARKYLKAAAKMAQGQLQSHPRAIETLDLIAGVAGRPN